MNESLLAFHAPTRLVAVSVIDQASHPYTRTEAIVVIHNLHLSRFKLVRPVRPLGYLLYVTGN